LGREEREEEEKRRGKITKTSIQVGSGDSRHRRGHRGGLLKVLINA